MMRTRGEARTWALGRIAPLDADVLLCHVLGVPREALYAHPEVAIAVEDAERFAALVARREAGEPVAYLRGVREFHGLDFAVDGRVLIPRPETEALVEAARERVRTAGARLIADIGTGSGAIAVALAIAEPGVHVIATDVSADALDVARANAARHGVAARIDFRRGHLLEPMHELVDVLCANLPYLREDAVPLKGRNEGRARESAALRFEPRGALVAGADGLALIRPAAADLGRVLAPGGAAYFELDPAQAPAVRVLLAPLGRTLVRKDLAGDERVVGVER